LATRMHEIKDPYMLYINVPCAHCKDHFTLCKTP
jgi:hypothetical protein